MENMPIKRNNLEYRKKINQQLRKESLNCLNMVLSYVLVIFLLFITNIHKFIYYFHFYHVFFLSYYHSRHYKTCCEVMSLKQKIK